MPSIRVENVPDDVHDALCRRAAASGQSLQEHLLAELTRAARTPTVAEVLERMPRRTGGRLRLRQAERMVRDDRDAR